jgi:hypothetical protein
LKSLYCPSSEEYIHIKHPLSFCKTIFYHNDVMFLAGISCIWARDTHNCPIYEVTSTSLFKLRLVSKHYRVFLRFPFVLSILDSKNFKKEEGFAGDISTAVGVQSSPMLDLQEGGSSTICKTPSRLRSVGRPKCNIYLCMMCRIELTKIRNEFPAKCPMCGGEMCW